MVFALSSSVYGDSVSLPKEESMPTAHLSPYAISKLVGEHYAVMYWRLFGLETVGLRYFNVFGPRQDPDSEYAAVIPKFLHGILNREQVQVYGDGSQSRDFTYVENVVWVMSNTLKRPSKKLSSYSAMRRALVSMRASKAR